MFGLPAAATKVGSQSNPEKIPFCTVSAGTLPGHRIIAGTRKPPSSTVPFDCANGVWPPSGHVKTSVPLSVVKTTMVLSSTPRSLSFFMTRPTSSSSWAIPASSSDQPFSELRIASYFGERCVTICIRVGLSQTKNGLPSLLAFSMNLSSEVAYFVVHRFHALWIERTGILDPLHSDLSPARHFGGIVFVGGPAMNHVAGADNVQEVLRIVGVCRVFHRV